MNILREPELLQRTVHEGHMVGGHTLTHLEFDDHSVARDREELVSTDRLIRGTGEYASRLFRLPFGNADDNKFAVLMGQQLGYLHVEYDLDTKDWLYEPTETIPVPELDGQGHVVLMHDGGGNRQQTLVLVQRLIDHARARGYTFVTLAPLLSKEYMPVEATPTVDDHLTKLSLWVGMVGWHSALTNGMRYGVTPAAFLMLLYVLIAWSKYWRPWDRSAQTTILLPPISILVPAYNEEDTLPATLSKLVQLNYPEYEVIVIENGSRDDTWGVASAFASVWPRMRALRSAAGKANALNLGIRAARYDVLVLVDADTLLDADALLHFGRHFANENVGVVAGNIKIRNIKGMLTRCQQLEYLLGIWITRLVEGVVVAPGACAAWRKTALLEVGGIHGDTLAEDCDATLRVRAAGWLAEQENKAIGWTQAPATLHDLWGQRIRWVYGTMQALWKNRKMLMHPRHGWLGMYVLPNAVISMLVSLLFMPAMYIIILVNCLEGKWQTAAFFSLFMMGIYLAATLAVIRMEKERWTYLLIVPFYRMVYEPFRLCVLYATTFKVIRGRAMKWYSPQREAVAMSPA